MSLTRITQFDITTQYKIRLTFCGIGQEQTFGTPFIEKK